MTRKLIATKALRYNTRSLVAGDEFDATDMHARILTGIRKARYAPEAPAKAVEKAEAEETAEVMDRDRIARMRIEARGLGVDVDMRWGMVRLSQEIAKARE